MIKILRVVDYVQTTVFGKIVYQRVGAYKLITLPFICIELVGR